MRVRLRDPSLLDELRQHFERANFTVEQIGADAVDVLPSPGAEPDGAETDARLLLMVWRTMHPGATAEPPD